MLEKNIDDNDKLCHNDSSVVTPMTFRSELQIEQLPGFEHCHQDEKHEFGSL